MGTARLRPPSVLSGRAYLHDVLGPALGRFAGRGRRRAGGGSQVAMNGPPRRQAQVPDRLKAGLAHHRAGWLHEAQTLYRQVLDKEPAQPDALHLLGLIAHQIGQHGLAVQLIGQAIAVNAQAPDYHANLAEAQRALGRLDEAEAVLRRAIAADPGSAMALNNLGNTLKDQGRIDEAIAVYRRALAIDPGFVDAQYNLSLALLTAGVLDDGWQAHECRWRRSDAPPPRRFPQPVWQGENVRGRGLLIWGEQGVGDEITQATMIPDLLRAGARCVVECDKRLAPLFARSCSGAEVVPRCDPPDPRTLAPDIDMQIAGGSLMRWLRPRVDCFPTEPGFLAVDPARRRLWRDRLNELGPGPKIGLSWMSSLTRGQRAQHFTRLADWAPILKRPGGVFVNLQYADFAADIDEARHLFGVTIHGWPDLDLKDDFDGVAALTSALDLVITGPCSVVNIAGAVGVPTWHVWRFPDWEMLGQPSRPFYPGERVFTGAWNRPWPELLAEVAQALGTRLS
ncbi:MAG: tetratricopeptide repeat protein [Rhodospirillaceae bacterium]|nr:tetratricopeptide repeat protein [Rhodospirillaceae bacterium]